MERSSLPLGLNKLKSQWDSSQLKCSLPFQRHSGMWSNIVKTNLVWGILTDSYIPPLVFLKDKSGIDEKGKDIYCYEILDGQQRLTTLFSFMEDGWALHASMPIVTFEGFEYELGGLRFSELPDELKDAIKGYRFGSIQMLENYTNEEIESLFFNINSGVALSTIQKSKSKLGTDLIAFLNGVLAKDFFTQAINITARQALSEDDLCLLLQTMLLLDNRHEDREYKNISTASCLSYAESIRNNYNSEKKAMLEELFDFLSQAFPERCKFLRKNNVPIVAVIGKIAMENGVSPEAYRQFIDSFSNACNYEYDEASGSGNIKAWKVQQRLRVLFLSLCDYIKIDPEQSAKPFSQNISLYPENSEENQNVEE